MDILGDDAPSRWKCAASSASGPAKPTALRAITMMNGLTGAEDVIPPFLASVATKVGVYQARGFNKATCELSRSRP